MSEQKRCQREKTIHRVGGGVRPGAQMEKRALDRRQDTFRQLRRKGRYRRSYIRVDVGKSWALLDDDFCFLCKA